MQNELPQLKYKFDALEPFIDAQTMEIHYSKHHQAYVNKLNEALAKHPEIADRTLEDLLSNIETLPEDIKIQVKNHGGGHFNHCLYWEIMNPNPKLKPEGKLLQLIEDEFDNLENLTESLNTEALNRFGSGWAWLALTKNNNLKVYSTANQDNPLNLGEYPIIGIDVWEHAYYLKYQNKRADYIKNWWSVLDWEAAESNLKKYML